MPSLEKPCLLLPDGCKRSAIYVCVPVDPNLAQQSTVLETLIEYEGVVDMPRGVSLEDFQEWSHLVTQDPSNLSFHELIFSLKVGEKLSGKKTKEEVKALANRCKDVLTSRQCPYTSKTDQMELLSLSKNMLNLLFHHMPARVTEHLRWWTSPLQQAWVDFWVTPNLGDPLTTYTLQPHMNPEDVIQMLNLFSQTDPSLPGLNVMRVACDVSSGDTTAALCSALLHHKTSISQLDIPKIAWEPSDASPHATTVFRILPELTNITQLSVRTPCWPRGASADAMRAAADGMHALAAALSALPKLAECHIGVSKCNSRSSREMHSARAQPTHCFAERAAPAPEPKRRKFASFLGPCGDDDGGSMHVDTEPLSLDPVVAALSQAPDLTKLTLRLADPGSCVPAFSGIAGGFAALQEFKCEVADLYGHPFMRPGEVCTPF